MNNFTQADWDKYSKMYKVLETFAYAYIEEFCSRSSLTSLEIVGDELNINTEEHFSGCGTDYEIDSIPLSWLSEDDLMDRCRKHREELKEQEIQRQIELKDKRVESERVARHNKFLELQKEFNGENNQNNS